MWLPGLKQGEGKMSAVEPAFSTAESAEGAENKSARLNRVTENIIGVAMRVHRALGPGLLESA